MSNFSGRRNSASWQKKLDVTWNTYTQVDFDDIQKDM